MTRRWIPWAPPTADRLVLALGALVVVLAGASDDDPTSISQPRDLDWLAGGPLVLGGATVLTIANMVVGGEPVGDALRAAGYLLMAVLFGELIRSRHLLLEQYAARAVQAKEDAERRVAEARLRIARDVHDLLAHTVSVMTVQAGVAREAIDRDAEAAKAALTTIRQAGQEAMGEMQATVSVLRSGRDAVSTAPSPRLDRVAELVDTTREPASTSSSRPISPGGRCRSSSS